MIVLVLSMVVLVLINDTVAARKYDAMHVFLLVISDGLLLIIRARRFARKAPEGQDQDDGHLYLSLSIYIYIYIYIHTYSNNNAWLLIICANPRAPAA